MIISNPSAISQMKILLLLQNMLLLVDVGLRWIFSPILIKTFIEIFRNVLLFAFFLI
jgi:hypothetical protein